MSYKRILLKLSGEILSGISHGDVKSSIDHDSCKKIASAIKKLHSAGVQIGIVIGGGNIFRGIQAGALGLPRTPADQMGMVATLINGIALQQSLEAIKCPTRLLSAFDCPKIAESYVWHNAMQYLAKNEVVIFVGGTGNPYFTTDTAAALRANEIQAEALFKATKVDGIYNKDPIKFSDAKKYETITYSQMLAEKLEVMDATSVALCMQSNIPIYVFNMKILNEQDALQLLGNKQIGTLVKKN